MKNLSFKGLFSAWLCQIAALSLLALAIPSQAAWELAWSDEFNGSSVDSTKWVFETGNNNGWGNSERQYYTSRTTNAYVSDGALHIVARSEPMEGFSYTSARLKTQTKFSQKYGRFEFRAKLPKGLGFWPALWMMGTNITSVGWPTCGEIDVMEFNGSWSNKVQATIHYPNTAGAHTSQTAFFTFPTPGDSATNFHTYALEWSTNLIKWLVDDIGVVTWRSWSSSAGSFPAPFNQPFFLLMNVAVGGSYLGYPSEATINANTIFPGEMQVDYVRTYTYVQTVPDAPTGFSASAANAKVFLSWETEEGASGYNVKRANASSGPYVTIASVPTNSYTDLSTASCSAYYYIVTATNSLGESPATAPQYASLGAFGYSVNSGGSAAGQFVADTGFSGGTQAGAVSTFIDVSGVDSPAPQSVYQTERYGNFSYTFTGLTNGVTYRLRLHLAETYWTAVGQRRFNVSINGTQVLSNFDIVAAVGAPNKAIVPEFNAIPTGGQIVVQFTTVTDNAKCSGIEVILPRTATPANLAASARDKLVLLDWDPVAGASSYTVKRATAPDGPFNVLASGMSASSLVDNAVTNGITYYYVVSALRAGCESTNSSPIAATPACTVPPTPVAANNGPIWEGMTLNLTASPAPGLLYRWSGPNGFSASVQNPVIPNATTNVSGDYSVVVISGSCESAPGTTLVTVHPPPSLSISLSNGEPVLSWPAGTLQKSTNINGLWQDLTGATSPLTNPASQAREFFRLRIP